LSEVIIEKEKFFYAVKLNRPKKHNAFNPEIIKQLTQFFKTAAKDKSVRAIYLSGVGPSFCAGADLEWMKSSAKFTMKQNLADAKALDKMFASAASCPLPIVSYLHGSGFGGGVGLAAISDIAVAEVETKFCFSEVRLGLVPAVISQYVLKKMLPNKAKEFMLTGQVFTAADACSAGLVEFSGRELESREYIFKALEKISEAGPEAVAGTKQLIGDLQTMARAEHSVLTTKVIAQRRVSKEGQEGLKAFFAKRRPNW